MTRKVPSNKTKKLCRYKNFEIEITTGIEGPQVNKLIDSTNSILETLNKIAFVTPQVLEKTLRKLVIQTQSRTIVLTDFVGQLEKTKSSNLPVWRVACQTSALVTRISLARAISEQLFSTRDSDLESSVNLIDPRITVTKQEKFTDLSIESRFSLPESELSPGYINSKLVSLFDSVEEAQIPDEVILEMIQKHPKFKRVIAHMKTLQKTGTGASEKTLQNA